MTVNKTILMGRLGKNPEIRQTTSGTSVATFSVATDDQRKNQSGNWETVTDWHNVVAFGKTAETIEKHFKKGSPIYIEGKLQTRKWQDKNGENRYTTEIIVRDFRFVPRDNSDGGHNAGGNRGGNGGGYSGGNQSNDGGGYSGGNQSNGDDGYSGGGQTYVAPTINDDDIPF